MHIGKGAVTVGSAALEQYLNKIIGIGLELATDVSKRKTAGIKPDDVIKAFMLTATTTGPNVSDISQVYSNLQDSAAVVRKGHEQVEQVEDVEMVDAQ